MITGRVQLSRIILIAFPRVTKHSTRESLRILTTTDLREGRDGRVLGVGVDEFGERVSLVGVSAGVRPGDLIALPCCCGAERCVGVDVRALAAEGLCHVGVDGDFGVGHEGVACAAVGEVGDC